MLSVLKIIEDTTVDGPGFRTAIYAAGCDNRCPGCHNPDSWDINKGQWIPIEQILEQILANEFANVTFSGGDPFFQSAAFARLAKLIKQNSRKTIWCYTGYNFETIIRKPEHTELLRYIDVLVDGRFMRDMQRQGLLFRGSENQRLLDVKASLTENKAISYSYNPYL